MSSRRRDALTTAPIVSTAATDVGITGVDEVEGDEEADVAVDEDVAVVVDVDAGVEEVPEEEEVVGVEDTPLVGVGVETDELDVGEGVGRVEVVLVGEDELEDEDEDELDDELEDELEDDVEDELDDEDEEVEEEDELDGEVGTPEAPGTMVKMPCIVGWIWQL